MKAIDIHVSHPYQVLIGRGLLSDCGSLIAKHLAPARVCVVTDSTVEPLYLQTVLASLDSQLGCSICSYTFVAGEASKTLATVSEIYSLLAENGFTRTDLLVALGGGVVGDITGFAAATFLRGLPFVQIPTTLLSQVDSSVGGKTGVDLPCGKNMVGAFWQPSLVICDPQVLSTLTPEIFSDGMGEVIKYAMIADRGLMPLLLSEQFEERLDDIIATCIDSKRKVVEADEFDWGGRMVLNFGHTIGHAAEKHSHFSLSHGRGVAIGMMAMTAAAVAAGDAPLELLDQLRRVCLKFGLPLQYDAVPLGALISLCNTDKKRDGSHINIALVTAPGVCQIRKLPFEAFERYLLGGNLYACENYTV